MQLRKESNNSDQRLGGECRKVGRRSRDRPEVSYDALSVVSIALARFASETWIGHIEHDPLHDFRSGHEFIEYNAGPVIAHQDRRLRRAPHSCHYLPTGRGGRQRPDGARHPRRHLPIASATAIHMTAIRTQTDQKRQDRSVRRAEKKYLPDKDDRSSWPNPDSFWCLRNRSRLAWSKCSFKEQN